MKKLTYAAALILSLSVGVAAYAAPDVKPFSTPDGDVSLKLPSKVTNGWGDKKQDEEDKTENTQRFMAKNDNDAIVLFSVTNIAGDTATFDQEVESVEKVLRDDEMELNKKESTFKVVRDVAKQGWTGRVIQEIVDGEVHQDLFMAEDQSKAEFALLCAVEPGSEAEFKAAVDSFNMNADVIAKKESARKQREWDNLFGVRNPGDVLSTAGTAIGLFMYLYASIWMLVIQWRVNPLWVLGGIAFPVVNLAFIFKYWLRCWMPFALGVFGGLIGIIGLCTHSKL